MGSARLYYIASMFHFLFSSHSKNWRSRIFITATMKTNTFSAIHKDRLKTTLATPTHTHTNKSVSYESILIRQRNSFGEINRITKFSV